MARPLRIEFEDAFYHVISRGNDSKNIFKKAGDRKRFLLKPIDLNINQKMKMIVNIQA